MKAWFFKNNLSNLEDKHIGSKFEIGICEVWISEQVQLNILNKRYPNNVLYKRPSTSRPILKIRLTNNLDGLNETLNPSTLNELEWARWGLQNFYLDLKRF